MSKPVGRGDYVVREGDGMSSIAEAHGFFWDSLWNLAENAELKAARPNPEVLMPGDRVTIPEKRIKSVTLAAGASHRFRRKGIPVRLILRLCDGTGAAFANARYRLIVGEVVRQGRTD